MLNAAPEPFSHYSFAHPNYLRRLLIRSLLCHLDKYIFEHATCIGKIKLHTPDHGGC